MASGFRMLGFGLCFLFAKGSPVSEKTYILRFPYHQARV